MVRTYCGDILVNVADWIFLTAIILADKNRYNGANKCTLWKVCAHSHFQRTPLLTQF